MLNRIDSAARRNIIILRSRTRLSARSRQCTYCSARYVSTRAAVPSEQSYWSRVLYWLTVILLGKHEAIRTRITVKTTYPQLECIETNRIKSGLTGYECRCVFIFYLLLFTARRNVLGGFISKNYGGVVVIEFHGRFHQNIDFNKKNKIK